MSTAGQFPGQKDLVHINLEMMELLSSAATYEVLLSFSFVEPRSIPDLALELGKSQATVGSHVSKLLKVGLIVEAGTRKKRSRTERLFVWTGRGTYHDFANQPKEYFAATSARTNALLRKYGKQYSLYMERVFHNEDDLLRGAMRWRPMLISKEGALVLREAMFEVHELAARLEAEAKAGEGSEHEHAFMITTFMPTIYSSLKRIRQLKHLAQKEKVEKAKPKAKPKSKK